MAEASQRGELYLPGWGRHVVRGQVVGQERTQLMEEMSQTANASNISSLKLHILSKTLFFMLEVLQ